MQYEHKLTAKTIENLKELEHFQEKLRLVPTGKEPAFSILRGDSIQRSFDRCIQFFRCPGFDPAQDRFHFAPHFLNRIEVGAVYREISVTRVLLWEERLSRTTISPGLRLGHNTFST